MKFWGSLSRLPYLDISLHFYFSISDLLLGSFTHITILVSAGVFSLNALSLIALFDPVYCMYDFANYT